jgi:hypothetical protein
MDFTEKATKVANTLMSEATLEELRELARDLRSQRSNMLAWTVRSWRIVGSGGGRIWTQWHDPRYLKPPGLACAIPRLSQSNQQFGVCGRKLARLNMRQRPPPCGLASLSWGSLPLPLSPLPPPNRKDRSECRCGSTGNGYAVEINSQGLARAPAQQSPTSFFHRVMTG